MIFEICASIATLIFIVLSIYIIQTLRVLQASLKSGNQVIQSLQVDLAMVRSDVQEIIKGSNETVSKINRSIEHFEPLLQSVSNLGLAIKEVTDTEPCEKHRFCFLPSENKSEGWQEKVFNLIELTSLGIKIFQQIQKRK